jgi:hypothetical protein
MIVIEIAHQKYELPSFDEAKTLVEILTKAKRLETSFAYVEINGKDRCKSFFHYAAEDRGPGFEVTINGETPLGYQEAMDAIAQQEKQFKESSL